MVLRFLRYGLYFFTFVGCYLPNRSLTEDEMRVMRDRNIEKSLKIMVDNKIPRGYLDPISGLPKFVFTSNDYLLKKSPATLKI